MKHFSPTSPTVSVLIAAQDAQGTLRRALESVQGQSLTNVEIVCVDAGSTDSTARMLDTASERDIRVVVDHVPACSREEALNRALDLAKGDYVTVMDADGWLEPTYLERLVRAVEERHLDLAVASLDVECAGARRAVGLEAGAESVEYLTQQEFRSNAWMHFSSGQLSPASGKLYVRSLIAESGARFDPESGNDHSFTMAYLRDIERAGFLDLTYHVVRDCGSGALGLEEADALYGRVEEAYELVLDLLQHWGMAGDAASLEVLASRYVEMLSICVEAASLAPGAGADGRALVARMISSERARLTASLANPRDPAAKALLNPIKTQNASMAVMQAKLLAMLRRGMPATLTPDAVL